MSEEARTVVVTGASSGIGAATAIEFGRAGYRVAVGARRVERIEAVAADVRAAGGQALALPLDITKGDSADAFCKGVEDRWGPVDILINNAGQNLSSLVSEATDEKLRADVEINLLGAMFMTRRVLPGMLGRQSGDVVFIGSDCAIHPRTYQSAYSASKAGLEIFSRVLEMETEGTGIRSLLVRVGPTGSEFGSRMPGDLMPEILASWKYWGVLRHLHWMSAESVARAILRIVSIPVDEIYPTVLEVQPGGRSGDHDPSQR